ncbi:hypothetical protein EDC04DRAFT_2722293 [Pisolithus marmoratus]|nr:hypothetical protein EDC04DRAFT_2722293 [Pisolithus marmoratus]
MLPSASATQGAHRSAGKGMAMGPQSSHKVLSLNSTTKKVTISSYTNTPISSCPLSPSPEELCRIPPPREIGYVKQPQDPEHPWKNMQFPNLQYIPAPKDLNMHSR